MTGSAIEVRGVHREYGSGAAKMVALNGVDLSIPSGSFVSVIGPSGCGKSTMLRLIAGLEVPDDGDVSVYGVSAEQACAAKMIGLVPQAPALLPWLSVLSNVTLPQKVNRGAAKRRKKIAQAAHRDVDVAKPDMMDLLKKAGLGDATHKLPSELSGGMQQRAAIVRAFGLRPDVLLMDEPFSALDEFTRESLQGQLLDMWEGLKTTVVFVTHSVGEAVRLSDTVVVMAARPGRITDIVPIDLPRPRDTELMKSREFHDLEDLVRDKLRAGWGMHAA